MTTDDLDPRVRAVVAAAFGEPASSITAASGNHSIPGWDSMNHIHLIIALEGEFGISFDPEEAVELTTVGAIERAVRRLQQA